jgi:hypothetical protein
MLWDRNDALYAVTASARFDSARFGRCKLEDDHECRAALDKSNLNIRVFLACSGPESIVIHDYCTVGADIPPRKVIELSTQRINSPFQRPHGPHS